MPILLPGFACAMAVHAHLPDAGPPHTFGGFLTLLLLLPFTAAVLGLIIQALRFVTFDWAVKLLRNGGPSRLATSSCACANSAGNSYGSYSGTSMATPHVTGACALYAASHTGASAAQIKTAILNAAVPTASLSGRCVTGGRLNVSGF